MSGKVTLRVTAGPLQGRSFEFAEADTFLFGRAPDCHAQLAEDDQTASRHPQLVGLEADGEARVVREAGGGPEFGRSHRRSEARGETGQLDEAVGIVHAGILLRAGVGVVGENFAAPLGRREPASRLRTPAHHALTRRGATDAYKSPTSSDSSPANPAERRVPGQHCLAALVT